MDRSDYFSFDLTIFDRKMLCYSSKGQAFDEEQDENPDSGEIEPLPWPVRILQRGYMNMWLWLGEKRTFPSLSDKLKEA